MQRYWRPRFWACPVGLGWIRIRLDIDENKGGRVPVLFFLLFLLPILLRFAPSSLDAGGSALFPLTYASNYQFLTKHEKGSGNKVKYPVKEQKLSAASRRGMRQLGEKFGKGRS